MQGFHDYFKNRKLKLIVFFIEHFCRVCITNNRQKTIEKNTCIALFFVDDVYCLQYFCQALNSNLVFNHKITKITLRCDYAWLQQNTVTTYSLKGIDFDFHL